MNTTELYIEQVLIGSMVIATALLPWLPDLVCSAKSLTSFGEALVLGSAWIGVSFLIGVPYDRFADTLTGRLERFAILFAALHASRNDKRSGSKTDGASAKDPFPVDEYLVTVLQGGSEGLIERLDYHRARVRISRAIGVIGPALTLSAAIGTLRFSDGQAGSDSRAILSIGLILLLYSAWWLMISLSSRLPLTMDGRQFAAFRRDFDRGFDVKQSQRKRRVSKERIARRWWCWQYPWQINRTHGVPTSIPQWRATFPHGQEWLMFVPAGLLFLITLDFVVRSESNRALVVAIAGIATSCIALGSFRRISQTYFEFLRKASIEVSRSRAERN